jgi:hypothetical protein
MGWTGRAPAPNGFGGAIGTHVPVEKRLVRRSKMDHYSIILFAPTSTISGNVRLSSLAVRKLTVS